MRDHCCAQAATGSRTRGGTGSATARQRHAGWVPSGSVTTSAPDAAADPERVRPPTGMTRRPPGGAAGPQVGHGIGDARLTGGGVGELDALADGRRQQRRGHAQVASRAGIGGARRGQDHGIRKAANRIRRAGRSSPAPCCARRAERIGDHDVGMPAGRDVRGDVDADVVAAGQEGGHQDGGPSGSCRSTSAGVGPSTSTNAVRTRTPEHRADPLGEVADHRDAVGLAGAVRDQQRGSRDADRSRRRPAGTRV